MDFLNARRLRVRNADMDIFGAEQFSDFSAAADFARQALERNPRNPEARELYSLLPKVPPPQALASQSAGSISWKRLLFLL